MIALDMRSIFLFGVLASALEAGVVTFLWLQNRSRFRGIGFWLLTFTLRFVAMTLVFYRDLIPDFLSVLTANVALICALLALLVGLERFVGRRRSHLPNYVLLAVFTVVHTYFTYMQPDLTTRIVNYAAASLVLFGQIIWLVLMHSDSKTKLEMRTIGLTAVAISAILVYRIVGSLLGPEYQSLLQSGSVNELAILGESVLWIGLSFALMLLVNRRLVGVLEHDIEQRQIAEESLRRSEEKFEIAFRQVPEAIIIAALEDGRLIEVNGGFSEMSGYQPHEVIGTDLRDLDFWVNPEVEAAFVSEITAKRKVLHHPAVLRNRSGETFPCIISADLIELGGETCVLALIHDDTDSQRAQETMREMNAELERRVQERTEELTVMNEELIEANKAKSEFLASMSHELRTPLNSIIGFSGVLAQELPGPLNPEQKLQIGMLHASGKHLLSLVDDILDLARIESGATRASFERFEVAPLVNSLMHMMRPLAEEKGLELSSSVDAEARGLTSDLRMVSQILTNLLGNAIKFTDTGSVRLEVSVAEARVQFAVIDTGRGIAPDDIARVSEQFFQADPIAEAKNPGAGLGLAISTRLAEMLGAEIRISSEFGVGSTFTLLVPIDRSVPEVVEGPE